MSPNATHGSGFAITLRVAGGRRPVMKTEPRGVHVFGRHIHETDVSGAH